EKLVQEAIASAFRVAAVYRREEIGESAMARLSALASPSPVLAVVEIPAALRTGSEDFRAPLPAGLCLALDGIRDPGNMGTILRLADWFGIPDVFASPDCVEFFNPKVVQASMGSLFRTQLHRTALPALCRRFSGAGRAVYGTFLDGENLYGQALGDDALILMGNEADGIREETAAAVTARLLIPRFGAVSGAESLNVAAATAITLAEFRRRQSQTACR
ncbi:MAG: RNA methyltransferase, partial [Bacteroidales bacterium]|nr:RNA methyltransferase [Bacteroidales bacterium]